MQSNKTGTLFGKEGLLQDTCPPHENASQRFYVGPRKTAAFGSQADTTWSDLPLLRRDLCCYIFLCLKFFTTKGTWEQIHHTECKVRNKTWTKQAAADMGGKTKHKTHFSKEEHRLRLLTVNVTQLPTVAVTKLPSKTLLGVTFTLTNVVRKFFACRCLLCISLLYSWGEPH